MKKMQDTVFERFQTDEEAQDASFCRQVFTEYCVFMDEKSVNGSLEKAMIGMAKAVWKVTNDRRL